MALVIGTNCGFVTSSPSADPGGSDYYVYGKEVAARFLTPDVAGITVTELGWYRSTASSSGTNYQIAIYDGGSTGPDNVVGSVQTGSSGTVGWKKKTGLSIGLSPNTWYWLAVATAADNYPSTTDGAGASGYNRGYSSHTNGTLDDPWTDSFTIALNNTFAIYALYTYTSTSTTTTTTSSSSTSSSTKTTVSTVTTITSTCSSSSSSTQSSQSSSSSQSTTTSSTQTTSSSQSSTTSTSPYFLVDDLTFCWTLGQTSTTTTSVTTTTSTSHSTTTTSHSSTSSLSTTSCSSSCTTTTLWTSTSTTTATFYSPDIYYWLFDIGDSHYSTQGVVYEGTTYLGRVIPDSFAGVSVKWNMGSNSLITPNEVSFDLFNADGFIDVDSLIDSTVIITYATMSDWATEDLRKWRFYVKYALESYGVIHVTCENYLSQFIDGDYPISYHPKEIWPSDDTDIEDLSDYCVPVIFGASYIPIMSVYTEDDDRYYVLGKGIDATYTIERVRSPRNWPTTSWWDTEMSQIEVLRLYLGEATGGTFTLTMPEHGESWVLNPGVPSAGTYTLGNGVSSEEIAYNDNAAAIQAHLETIYGAGKVSVTDGDDGEYDIYFPIEVAGNVEESGLVADFTNLTDAIRPYLTQTRTYCPGGTTGNLSYEATSGNASAIETAIEALCGEQVTVEFSGGIAAATEWMVGAGEYRQWTVPDGVYEVTAECWGGGGCPAGSSVVTPKGTNQTIGSTGGAGGGAYSKRVFSVTPGQKVDYYFAGNRITAGSGASSWFSSNDSDGCVARGGGQTGTGGQASSGYGDTKYSGGNGYRGDLRQYVYETDGMLSYAYSSYDGGPGGGGAGTTGNGNSGAYLAGGAAKSLYGGAGGAGRKLSSYEDRSCYDGDNGDDFGGGGGGVKNSYWWARTTVGGYGGKGAIRVSYGGGAYFFIAFTSYVGSSGMTANFTNLTGETYDPSLNEYQQFIDEIEYDFNQSDSGDYKLCQFIIDDRDADGTADSNGLWLSGEEFLPPLVKYYRSDTYFLDNPTEVLEYVLTDIGLTASDLDSTSWGTTETTLDTREVIFSGGMWEKESTEKVIANMLTQFDGYIYESDTVELHLFDSTSVETIDTSKTIAKSFRPTSKSKYSNDGGRVAWHEAETPQDILTGKAIVRLYQDQLTITKPAREVLNCSLLTNSISAQKAGILYFAKKYLVTGSDTFSVPITHLETRKTLKPGMVLTIDDSMFGTEHDIVVTQIDFDREGEVKIVGARMQYIEDWDEIYADAVEVRASSSDGWNIYTADGTLNFAQIPVDPDLGDLSTGDIYYDSANAKIDMKT